MSARIPRGLRADTHRTVRKDSAPRPLYPTRPDPTRPVSSGCVGLVVVQDLHLHRSVTKCAAHETAGAGR